MGIMLLLLCSGPAGADALLSQEDLGMSESDMAAGVKSGRIGKDELIRRGQELPYFTKLKLYYYAQKLEPYFLGLEDAFRELARTPAGDAALVTARTEQVAQAMTRVRQGLLESNRDDPEADWRRGLAGLIFLDYEWRQRIYQAGQDEIKNPYDLVGLVDCMDARIRGLEKGAQADCRLQLKTRDLVQSVPVE